MKNKHSFTTLVALFIFINNLFSQDCSVRIYPEILKQRIESVGGNYCQANYTGIAWDNIGEATLREFKPSHVRVALPLQFSEKEFEEYKGANLLKQAPVISLLDAMQRMKNQFGVANFTVSVWRVADELVDKPERRDKRRILPDNYEDVIDMIVVFLEEAKEKYGVDVDYFSFNESDGGYMTIFSPEETIRFIKMAAERFKKAGLKTKFLWADTAQTKGTVEFATMIAADSTVWKYLGPLCFHSWWSEKIPDSEFERIASLAKAWEKQVWCSELGFDAMAWRTKGMNQSWDYAFRFAIISHRMLKYAEVSVSMYWTWQDNYAIMSADTLIKYPSYFITKHFTDFLNRDVQVVHSTASVSDILSFSAINDKNQVVLQLINTNNNPMHVKLEKFRTMPIRTVSSTQLVNWKENVLECQESASGMQVELEGNSVNTLIFENTFQ